MTTTLPSDTVPPPGPAPRRLPLSMAMAFVFAAAAGPGLLAGAQLTGLLFFLNPQVPLEPGPFLRGFARYGSLLGAASALIHLPFLWGRPGRAGRLLPWSLAAVLAVSALAAWRHAAHFAFYLPPGINDRLLKAALWLSVGALVAGYTAFVHSARRREYGHRSRALLWLVALASIWAIVERREAFRPRPPAEARPTAAASDLRQPNVWVVGIETATFDAILPLAERGRLPFLDAALEQGAWGRLQTITPVRRSPLWTSLATGSYPFRHGLLGPTAHDAEFLAPQTQLTLLPQGLAFDRWGLLGSRVRTAARQPRRSPAIWDVLARIGEPAGVVGWPALTNLPERTTFAVSDRFLSGAGDESGVRPVEWLDRARMFRVAAGALDSTESTRLGPDAPESLRRVLNRDVNRESLALALYAERVRQTQRPGAVFLYLPGLYSANRNSFGGFTATAHEGSARSDDRRAHDLVAAYLEHLDSFLATLWRQIPEPRMLVVVSPFGIEGSTGWRAVWGRLHREQALRGRVDHGPDGVLLWLGEGVRSGAPIRGARLVDLAPTLAYALGAPISRELDGQVLTGVFTPAFLAARPLSFVGSYAGLLAPPQPAPLDATAADVVP